VASISVDVAVCGGGLVGAAVAYGLALEGLKVAVLDQGDVAYRASRGNFGLVWVQSKGVNMPDYASWTQRSATLWPSLRNRLESETGVDVNYDRSGGLHLCFSEEDLEKRRDLIHRMDNILGPRSYGTKLLDRQQLKDIMPGLGPDVIGASWSPHDGHASPLRLLRALHSAIARCGGQYHADHAVDGIEPRHGVFIVSAGQLKIEAKQVVLAAGLGNRALGPMVGIDVPVKPLKGQILVTERCKPVMPMATHIIRQTAEGTIMLGDSYEDVGFDVTSTAPTIETIAEQAIKIFPMLRDVRLVRTWAALRVMTPNGIPLYRRSSLHSGAFALNCHSGVTLAAAHALALAPMIARGEMSTELANFS
jgi:glycine/D-amino acid oxidase-like deaminating enzyme